MSTQAAGAYSLWGKTQSVVSSYLLLSEIPGHWFYLLHIHDGRGSLRRAGKILYPLQPGSLLLLHASTGYLLQTAEGLSFTCFLIESDINAFAPVVHLQQIDPRLRRFVDLLEKRPLASEPGEKSDLLAVFFAELQKTVGPAHPQTRPCRVPIEALKHILDTRYSESLCLDQFAEELYINKFQLVKEFKRAFGLPPIEYLLNRRIEEACRLLCSTDLKAVEVGRKVGLPNPTYFTRAFKTKTGHTPLSFRREHRV